MCKPIWLWFTFMWLAFIPLAPAADYPTRQINMVIPTAPGGSASLRVSGARSGAQDEAGSPSSPWLGFPRGVYSRGRMILDSYSSSQSINQRIYS